MNESLWYKDTVIYNLDVCAFMDSDGDGVGDFEGLMRRLDHLDALGIGTIWLAPFYPTPGRDNGYDVADHYGIDPRFGSGGDFAEFLRPAGDRGIKVIIDLVANHTSDQHAWFRAARGDRRSKYRRWYVWSEERPPGADQGLIYPGWQKETWTYDEAAGAYYFHRFYDFEPDLAIENPEVRRELGRIMGYWLALGVAGFRMDAVPFAISPPPLEGSGLRPRFDYLEELRSALQRRRGDAVLLGEVNIAPGEERDYFGPRGDRLQMMFNFHVNQRVFLALATADVGPLADALRATRDHPPAAQWAHFLRNHDELDLGRLTADQRSAVFDRFAPEERMRLYGRGTRRRLAPMLDGDRRRIELANSLLLSLPGTPVLRYGDEIGMGDDLDQPERYSVRAPMQWSDGPQAGFSTAAETIRPVINRGRFGSQRVNVDAQRRDPESLLNWMARMIRLRKGCPEIGRGRWEVLETGSPRCLALRYDGCGDPLIVAHNFDDRPHELRLRPGEGAGRLEDLLGGGSTLADPDGEHRMVLGPYGYRWARAGRRTAPAGRESG